MPSIEITSGAMDYLKSLAEPFVDTPATVLDRIIEQHRAYCSGGTDATDGASERVRYGIESLPPLLHAKIETASIESRQVARPKWTVMVEEMVRAAAARGASSEEITGSMQANAQLGPRSDAGFVFIPEAGLSLQKMDANRSCRSVLALSRRFGIAVSIDFFWRDEPSAFNPGAAGRIVGP